MILYEMPKRRKYKGHILKQWGLIFVGISFFAAFAALIFFIWL